jgi:integrase
MRSQCRRWFDPHFKGMPIAAISTSHCQALLTKAASIGQKPATVRQLAIRGRLIFKHAVETEKWLEENPWVGVRRPTVPKEEPVFLRKEQVNAMLLAAGPYQLLLLTAVLAGLRRGELGGLLWTDIDWEEGEFGTIHVRRSWGGRTTKSKKERSVPIHPRLQEELLRAQKLAASAWVFASPRTGEMRSETWHVSRLVKSVMKRAGIPIPPGFRFHSLRATFITHLWKGTGDITAAQRLAGHSTPVITERAYAGKDLEYLAKAVGTLTYGDVASQHTNGIQGTPVAETPGSSAQKA